MNSASVLRAFLQWVSPPCHMGALESHPLCLQLYTRDLTLRGVFVGHTKHITLDISLEGTLCPGHL